MDKTAINVCCLRKNLVIKLVTPLSSLRQSGHTLSTESLQEEDSGEYICETWNVANTCRYTINLEVEPREEGAATSFFRI